jgi:hypothetical protein
MARLEMGIPHWVTAVCRRPSDNASRYKYFIFSNVSLSVVRFLSARRGYTEPGVRILVSAKILTPEES